MGQRSDRLQLPQEMPQREICARITAWSIPLAKAGRLFLSELRLAEAGESARGSASAEAAFPAFRRRFAFPHRKAV